MFYYYGRKKQFCKHYPIPICETIIEPFAGSASYSLFGDNWKKDVILIEKDPSVADIWNWLINKATPEGISSMKIPEIGEKSSDFFIILHAATKMAFYYKTIKTTPVMKRNLECSIKYISNNLYKIKHWKIINGDYTEAPDISATWFIDPPYQKEAGKGYRFSNLMIDYNKLGEWIQSRKGQTIACEGKEADYLDFKEIYSTKGVAGKINKELIFYKEFGIEKDLSDKQLALFS